MLQTLTVNYLGEQNHIYEEFQLSVYSVELYEESGSNLLLVITDSDCNIKKQVETWNSDKSEL